MSGPQWPPNTLLRFDPGLHYTLHTKDGHVLTGRCVSSSPDAVWLNYPAGTHIVQTGAIRRIDNLEPRGPR